MSQGIIQLRGASSTTVPFDSEKPENLRHSAVFRKTKKRNHDCWRNQGNKKSRVQGSHGPFGGRANGGARPYDNDRKNADEGSGFTDDMYTERKKQMKIMVGYKGAKAGKVALNLARLHAKVFGAKVDVVTSLNRKFEKNSQKIREAEKGLEYAKKIYAEAGIPCNTTLLSRGLSHGEDIVKFADENDIDEIIIGASRSSLVGKLVFGNTAQFVILHANCPVILTKERLYNKIDPTRYLKTEDAV